MITARGSAEQCFKDLGKKSISEWFEFDKMNKNILYLQLPLDRYSSSWSAADHDYATLF